MDLNALQGGALEEEKEIFSVSGRPTNRPQCTMSEFRIREDLKEAKPRRKNKKKGRVDAVCEAEEEVTN